MRALLYYQLPETEALAMRICPVELGQFSFMDRPCLMVRGGNLLRGLHSLRPFLAPSFISPELQPDFHRNSQ